jgi:hypothetical protein
MKIKENSYAIAANETSRAGRKFGRWVLTAGRRGSIIIKCRLYTALVERWHKLGFHWISLDFKPIYGVLRLDTYYIALFVVRLRFVQISSSFARNNAPSSLSRRIEHRRFFF